MKQIVLSLLLWLSPVAPIGTCNSCSDGMEEFQFKVSNDLNKLRDAVSVDIDGPGRVESLGLLEFGESRVYNREFSVRSGGKSVYVNFKITNRRTGAVKTSREHLLWGEANQIILTEHKLGW